MANKTFNTRVKNKRDTAANWEAVATTFQPLDGELIIVDTAAGKTRFKVGRYDTAKGRLLYYNEIPFADEYLYNDLNESQGKIYDKLKGIDDKSFIEMTLEPFAGADDKVYSYRIGLWQFPKTGFYKINLPKVGAQGRLIQLFARITQDDGTTPEDDWATANLKRMSFSGGDGAVDSIYALAEYADNSAVTAHRVQFFNFFGFPGTVEVNTYDKTTQKWTHLSVARSDADTANKVGNALTLTKGDTTTKFDGSTAQTVSIPTKTSELTNDSDFTTQTDLDNLGNTVVSYNAQTDITDEQKAQARTNIGAISSSDLVQADWNQNDTEAKDFIQNKSLEVPYWEEFGTWTTTYNSFDDNGYLATNVADVTLCLEVNDTRFENLTYTSGSYGAFTLGGIDTIGVKISNNGYGSSTNYLTVSETMFPDGVTSAHIYRKSLKKLPLDALPEKIEWIVELDENSIVKTSNTSFVRDNGYLDVIKSGDSIISGMKPFYGGKGGSLPLTLYQEGSNNKINKNIRFFSSPTGSSTTVTLLHPDNNNRTIEDNEMPYGPIMVAKTYDNKLVLLNPRRPLVENITSSSTNRQYAGAKAVYDYVETAIPTVDDALSDTSTNPVQNKVVKAAIDDLQANIDSKPSAADAVYTATAASTDGVAVYTATAASTDGVAYTATVSGIDSLTVGASFIMIPNKASTSKAPTLNVNGLGAKPIRRRLSSLTTSLQQGYSTNWIALNKPFTVVYDGTAWVIEGLTKTDGADVYGAVAQATADAKGNNIADTYATIAMLKSLLPKVTTITLTSNWVGDASPYYQDIALSCVTETSVVDLQPTPEQLNSWQDDGIAFTTLSGNGTVRVYVAGGKPSSAISVQVRVQEVTVI